MARWHVTKVLVALTVTVTVTDEQGEEGLAIIRASAPEIL